MLAAPGEGDTLQHCEATCQVVQQHRCNWQTLTCEACSASDPGCEKQDNVTCSNTCKQPETLYQCDNTTQQCSACNNAYCTSDAQCPGSYCDINGPGPWTCHGNNCQQQFKCQAACSCDTPDEILGVNRGIQVDKDWKGGEFAFNFQAGLKVSLTHNGLTSVGTMSCPQNRQFSIKWVSGWLTGATWSGLYESWQQGPTTEEFAFAFAVNTSVSAPTSVEQAINGGGYVVFSTSKCLKGTSCSFTPPASLLVAAAASDAHVSRALRGMFVDPCNQFSSCSTCLTAASGLCGWCDTPVVYVSGATGYNCAGFDSVGKANPPWICHVKYRRYSCFDYGCNWTDTTQPQCYPLPEGQSGMTKEVCQLGCQPAGGLYKCNNQTFTCDHCDVKYCSTDIDCPGSYCQIDNSKPGPYICHGGIPDGCDVQSKCAGGCLPPDWGYTWRGVQIDAHYASGEYDMTIYAAQQMVAWRNPAGHKVEASLKLGKQSAVSEGTAIVLTIASADAGSGFVAGTTYYGLYEILVSDKNQNLKFLFLAFDTVQPTTFDAAGPHGFSFFLQTCDDAPNCNFTPAKVSL